MRTIFTIIALFSVATLFAQPPVAEGREPSRCPMWPSATAEEAANPDLATTHRYYARAGEWTEVDGGYRTTFTRPFAWANRRTILRLESAPRGYEVLVNGHRAGFAPNGNTPTEFDVTKLAVEGRNTLEIKLCDASYNAPVEAWKEGAEQPAPARAWLMSPPTMRVRDVAVKCSMTGEESAIAEFAAVVCSGALNARTTRFSYELLNPAGEVVTAGNGDMTLELRGEDTLRFATRIPVTDLWSVEQPNLHTLRIRTIHEGRNVEFSEVKIGLRDVGTAEGDMFLNGSRTPLKMVAIDAREADADRLHELRDQGVNCVMFNTGELPDEVLSRCDAVGMMVIAQVPIDSRHSGESRLKGGNPSNNPAWSETYVDRALTTYHTTKRHASVVAFSLARESQNGIALYEAYLALKGMKDSRPVIYLEADGEWNNDALTFE